MLDQCDVVFATNFAYERVRELSKNHYKIIKLDIVLDQSNFTLIHERLVQAVNKKRKKTKEGAKAAASLRKAL